MTTFAIASSGFAPGCALDARFTGDGRDVSPALSWCEVPVGTVSFALICDDPDAPRADPWVHWVLYNIPGSVTALPEGVPTWATLDEPPGARQGKNSWGTVGYRGPAPPRGHGTHHYQFRVYALGTDLDRSGLDKTGLLRAMEGHVLGVAQVVGTYTRPGPGGKRAQPL